MDGYAILMHGVFRTLRMLYVRSKGARGGVSLVPRPPTYGIEGG